MCWSGSGDWGIVCIYIHKGSGAELYKWDEWGGRIRMRFCGCSHGKGKERGERTGVKKKTMIVG